MTKSEPLEKAKSDDVQPTQVIGELRRSYTSKLEEVPVDAIQKFFLTVLRLNSFNMSHSQRRGSRNY